MPGMRHPNRSDPMRRETATTLALARPCVFFRVYRRIRRVGYSGRSPPTAHRCILAAVRPGHSMERSFSIVASEDVRHDAASERCWHPGAAGAPLDMARNLPPLVVLAALAARRDALRCLRRSLAGP